MGQDKNSARRPGRSRAVALGLFAVLAAACADSDRVGPSSEIELGTAPDVAAAATASGIVFASTKLTVSQLNTVHTGIVYTATPSGLLTTLSQVKAKGGRVLIRLAGGENDYKNADGTFNLAKWKSGADKFRNINFNSYITDGTIVGHFILDEPHFPSRWGNKAIPQATVEEVAKYSKQLWPNLPTLVAAPANWLAQAPVTYVNLDAAWATWRAKTASSPTTWIANQVSRAKSKGLGLVVGLNVLDGGDGSSGIRGTLAKTWAMSATELKNYGTALLNQSYACAFVNWRYDAGYYGRTDIKTAMADLGAKARSHAKTSCKQ
jgi:hypothetical protein